MNDYGGTIFNMPGKPRDGLSLSATNLTELVNHAGKVVINCPVCGKSFTRYASHAKRYSVCYCGVACKNEGERKTVKMHCVVCSSVFESIPCKIRVRHQVTCSKSCSSLWQSELVKTGILLPTSRFRTRADGKGKITVTQVQEIGESTKTTKVLANIYSVSENTIRNVKREWQTRQGLCTTGEDDACPD